jgi:hypothetical protein
MSHTEEYTTDPVTLPVSLSGDDLGILNEFLSRKLSTYFPSAVDRLLKRVEEAREALSAKIRAEANARRAGLAPLIPHAIDASMIVDSRYNRDPAASRLAKKVETALVKLYGGRDPQVIVQLTDDREAQLCFTYPADANVDNLTTLLHQIIAADAKHP